MDKSKIQTFITRITQASKSGLVVITYDIILGYIDSAMEDLENKDTLAFQKNIKEAQKFLRNLQDNLDMNVDLSKDLMALYIFCNKRFIEASVKNDSNSLEVIKKIIVNLRDGFQELALQDNSSIMENTEQIYAGLTYGKSALNETTLYSEQRGYKV